MSGRAEALGLAVLHASSLQQCSASPTQGLTGAVDPPLDTAARPLSPNDLEPFQPLHTHQDACTGSSSEHWSRPGMLTRQRRSRRPRTRSSC